MGAYISESCTVKVAGESIFEKPDTTVINLGPNTLCVYDARGQLVVLSDYVHVDNRLLANPKGAKE